MKEAIEKVIAELKKEGIKHFESAFDGKSNFKEHMNKAYECNVAIKKLKEVIANETSSQCKPNGSRKNDRTRKVDKPNS